MASPGTRGPTPLRPAALLVALAALGLLACASAPRGPGFARADAPPADLARLYVYRGDPRPSFARVRLELDDQALGDLRDGEYTTLLVAPGPHLLEAGLRSAAFVAWGWNDQRLRLAPGETRYVRVSVRVQGREHPPASGLEIGGRPTGTSSENVYLQIRSESDALRELAETTRGIPPNSGGAGTAAPTPKPKADLE